MYPFPLPLLYLGGAVLGFVSSSAVPSSINIFVDNRSPERSLDASNSTLGFEAILVLSSENQSDPAAWRQRGIRQAASRVGLDLEIPPQRDYTWKEVIARRDNETSLPLSDGEALCYVAHMDALQQVIDRRLRTALILEDDADWDVALRRQTRPVAQAVRLLTGAPNAAGAPYGDAWDLLVLGHCGEAFDATGGSGALAFDDRTRIPTRRVKNVNGPEQYAGLGDRERVVQRSRAPACSFGYAVNGRRARKVLDWLRGPGRALDLKYRDGCASGALDCLSVVPELIRHARRVGAPALSTAPGRTVEDPAAAGRQFTYNIKWSARCNWNRWGGDLRSCLPDPVDWERYDT